MTNGEESRFGNWDWSSKLYFPIPKSEIRNPKSARIRHSLHPHLDAMRFAICQELFEGWDWERQCRFIAEVGYQGIEAAPFALAPRITDLPAYRRRILHEQAADQGLQIIGLHWLLAKTEGLHL